MKKIFLSYSCKNKKIADQLDSMFMVKKITLVRDERDLDYRQSIKEFMKQVRESDYVLMIISEEYLKSINCMYELTEFIKDESFKDRILPLVQKNTDIFSSNGRIKYITHWQDEYNKLHKEANTLYLINSLEVISDLRRIEEIQRKISEFISKIADMNVIVFDNDIKDEEFTKIYNAIYPDNRYYMLNVPRTIKNREYTMIWWKIDDKGYTDDLRHARIFTHEEVIEKFKYEWRNKKFTAVPMEVSAKFKQTVVPFTERFILILNNDRDKLIGNINLYLSEDDIYLYI